MKRHIYIEYASGNLQQFYCVDYKFIEKQFHYQEIKGSCWFKIYLNGIKSITIFKSDDVENRLLFTKGVDF